VKYYLHLSSPIISKSRRYANFYIEN